MSTRSLNKVLLIGNLTGDPELRYTPQGTAVTTFSVATNRNWTDQSGQQQEDVEFTRCVAWSKIAEICAQLLFKGRKVFIEGRLQTREWEGQDKSKRRTTEVVVENMIALGAPQGVEARVGAGPVNLSAAASAPSAPPAAGPVKKRKKLNAPVGEQAESVPSTGDEVVPAEDIPF